MNGIAQRVDAGWRDLLDAIDGIPHERMVEPGVAGEWSVKDVLGHVAYWDAAAVRIIERRLRGEPDPERDDDWDYEPINQAERAARVGLPLETVRNEMFDTHERLLAALHQGPPIDPEDLAGNTWEHYQEHARDIRAWREQVGT